MRKFYLHTYDKARSFDLNTTRALATDPTGLGNSFSLSYKESDRGNHLTNSKPKFDPITFKIYFNADGTSGYVNYKSLISFLASCGNSKFLLEYDDGITDKYCEVVLKSIPKTETNSDGVFMETLSLDRQSYWYEPIDETFVFADVTTEQVFPMSFPFGFQGSVLTSEKMLENPLFVPAPIVIHISGEVSEALRIYVKNASGETVSELAISEELPAGTTITVDPVRKKILLTDEAGNVTNGYRITDKTKQSFLYLPQGTYTVGANIVKGASGRIEMSIKRYLFD